MREALTVPKAGESITEGVIAKWVKGEGQFVKEGDVIAEVETDKATVEIYAPFSGTVVQVLKQAGEKAAVEEVVGYIEKGNAPAGATGGAPSPVVGKPSEGPAPNPQPGYGGSGAGSNGGPAGGSARPAEVAPRVMPSAQRAAAESGVPLDAVKPSGPKGQILKEDVIKAAGTAVAPAPAATPSKPAATTVAKPVQPAASVTTGDRQQEVVPMSPIRKRIAQRLVEAQQTAALLTTFNEIDMSGVNALRAKFKDGFQEKYQAKLGFTSFFVKAVIEALKAFPAVNAEIRGDDIIYKNYYDIGIAVGGGKGLLVPIIRNAERLSFAEIEQAVVDFGARAKANKIKLEELEGGTFTITNGGVYGSLMSTPIINPPQSAILGLHAIQDRPVVVDGQVVVRPMMYVALTYDHRIIDGREAVSFLKTVKLAIEDPARILLEL